MRDLSLSLKIFGRIMVLGGSKFSLFRKLCKKGIEMSLVTSLTVKGSFLGDWI